MASHHVVTSTQWKVVASELRPNSIFLLDRKKSGWLAGLSVPLSTKALISLIAPLLLKWRKLRRDKVEVVTHYFLPKLLSCCCWNLQRKVKVMDIFFFQLMTYERAEAKLSATSFSLDDLYDGLGPQSDLKPVSIARLPWDPRGPTRMRKELWTLSIEFDTQWVVYATTVTQSCWSCQSCRWWCVPTLDGFPSQRLTNWINFSSTINSSRPDT